MNTNTTNLPKTMPAISVGSGDLLALLRAELLKAKGANVAALNLLSVLAPIDWDYVFSAPGNGQQNAQRVKDAVKWLENALS